MLNILYGLLLNLAPILAAGYVLAKLLGLALHDTEGRRSGQSAGWGQPHSVVPRTSSTRFDTGGGPA